MVKYAVASVYDFQRIFPYFLLGKMYASDYSTLWVKISNSITYF